MFIEDNIAQAWVAKDSWASFGWDLVPGQLSAIFFEPTEEHFTPWSTPVATVP